MHLPNPVDYAVPAFVLLVFIEMLVAWTKDRTRYEPKDTLTSLALGTGSNAIAPLVHDGVLFVHSSNTVSAIDGRNGDVIWSFDRPAVTQRVPMNQPRSMALYGRNLYVPTLDNHVLALDARSGKLVWDHQIGKDGDQIQLTAAPLVVRGKIIQPVAGCQGGVYPGGCFVVALDGASGKEIWRALKTGDNGPGYSPPTIIEAAGVRPGDTAARAQQSP